jgi:hypothetical protein
MYYTFTEATCFGVHGATFRPAIVFEPIVQGAYKLSEDFVTS